MVNCEGALSDHGRQVGLNRTPERFALLMRNARIDLVNLGNNHTFDAEERGFSTRRALFHWPGLPMSAAEWILPIPAGLYAGCEWAPASREPPHALGRIGHLNDDRRRERTDHGVADK